MRPDVRYLATRAPRAPHGGNSYFVNITRFGIGVLPLTGTLARENRCRATTHEPDEVHDANVRVAVRSTRPHLCTRGRGPRVQTEERVRGTLRGLLGAQLRADV